MSRSINAAVWGYAGSLIKLTIQVFVQLILARKLGPHEYGLFTIGVILISFALFFCDVFTSAIIPKIDLSKEDINFAFTWQLILSSIATISLFAMADSLAIKLNQPDSSWIIRYLSFICILNAIGGISLALLRRKVDFKSIQISDLVGYIVGYVVIAVPYAVYVNHTAAALVLAWISQTITTSILYLYFSTYKISLICKCKDAKEIITYGLHSLAANLSTWAMINVDKILVARTFSVLEVGLYSTSSSLLSTPLAQIYSTLQQITLSSTAKLDNQNAGKVFSALISLVLFLVGIGFLFTFIFAKLIVILLYGDNWLGAVPFIKVFSITLFFHAISGVITPLLWAHGAVSKDAKVQFLMAIFVGFGSIYFSTISAVSIAWWVATVFGFRAMFLLIVGVKIFPESKVEIFQSVIRFSIFFLPISTFFYCTNQVLAKSRFNVFIQFSIALSLFLILFYLMLKCRKFFGVAFFNTVDGLIKKLPTSIRCFF